MTSSDVKYSSLDDEKLALLPPKGLTASPKFPLGNFPPSLRPYLELIRIEKPTGTILMFWPFAWGLTIAFILRCSACTVNDIFDRYVDAGVERTRHRPLPSGRISVFAATVFLFAQYFIGVIFFYLTLKDLAFIAALFQLLPLFAIYPLLKRYTHWPQAWLGLAMNFGFITAWIATTGAADVALLICSVTGCWCWTMLYDTIYACQDIQDDLKMGVRSTAILFGTNIRPLLVCCGLVFVAMLAVAGYLNNQGIPYFIFSVGGTCVHLVWQYMSVNFDVPESCWANFKLNGHLGWLIWTGLMVDYVYLLVF